MWSAKRQHDQSAQAEKEEGAANRHPTLRSSSIGGQCMQNRLWKLGCFLMATSRMRLLGSGCCGILQWICPNTDIWGQWRQSLDLFFYEFARLSLLPLPPKHAKLFYAANNRSACGPQAQRLSIAAWPLHMEVWNWQLHLLCRL
jgi:hypothetical protein